MQELTSWNLAGCSTGKWQADSAAWRASLGVLPAFNPYTKTLDLDKAGLGLLPSKRVLDLLDCNVMQAAKRAKKTVRATQPLLQETLLDVSQSHARGGMPSVGNPNRCLTTSSRLWSFAQSRVLSGTEHLLLQGHTMPLQVPHGVSQTDLRRWSGEGIALPCLATVLWALKLTANFP